MNKKPETKNNNEKDERREYFRRKRELYELEKENYDKIYFLRGMGGFFSVSGHSAVILAYKIAPEVKIRVGIRPDTDYESIFKEGVIRVKNTEFYRKELEKSVYLDSVKVERGKGRFYFPLKAAVSKTEYELLLKSKALAIERFRNEIEETLPLPKTSASMRDALRLTYSLYRKAPDANARHFIFETLRQVIIEVDYTLRLITRNDLAIEAGVKKINAGIEKALCILLQTVDIEVLTPEKAHALAHLLLGVKSALEIEMFQIRKKKETDSEEIRFIKEKF